MFGIMLNYTVPVRPYYPTDIKAELKIIPSFCK